MMELPDIIVRMAEPFLGRSRYWYRNLYLRSRHWRKTRAKKLKQVWHCERCRMKIHYLDVHHKTYARIWREYLSDLEVLCRDCHIKEHTNYVR